jgi:hypothetical protein
MAQGAGAIPVKSMTYEWRLKCFCEGMTNSTFSTFSTFSSFDASGCLSCERCAHLLRGHESMKAEQAKVRQELDEVKHFPDSVSARQLRLKAEELNTLLMEAREVYAEHRASHRRAVEVTAHAEELVAA